MSLAWIITSASVVLGVQVSTRNIHRNSIFIVNLYRSIASVRFGDTRRRRGDQDPFLCTAPWQLRRDYSLKSNKPVLLKVYFVRRKPDLFSKD